MSTGQRAAEATVCARLRLDYQTNGGSTAYILTHIFYVVV